MRGELLVHPTSFSGSVSDTNVVWMLTDRGTLYTAPSLQDEWIFVSRVRAVNEIGFFQHTLISSSQSSLP